MIEESEQNIYWEIFEQKTIQNEKAKQQVLKSWSGSILSIFKESPVGRKSFIEFSVPGNMLEQNHKSPSYYKIIIIII